MEKRATTSREARDGGAPPEAIAPAAVIVGWRGIETVDVSRWWALMQSSGLDRDYSSLPWHELMKSRYQVKLSFLIRSYVPLP